MKEQTQMGTYKSNARTVLNTTITSATSYSSGPLDVGDLFELAMDCNVTAQSTTNGENSLILSRIGADGNLYQVGGLGLPDTGGVAGTGPISTSVTVPFGDRIQIDLVCPSGNQVTTTISIIGKGQ
jgi:hypothetical protein